MKIVLASKSPRRKAVLEEHGYDIVVDVSGLSGWQDAQVNIKATNVNAYLQGFSLIWE